MKLRTGNHLDSPLTPPSWDYFLPFIRIGAPRSSRLIPSHPSAIFYARFEQGRGKKEEEKKKKKGKENKSKNRLKLEERAIIITRDARNASRRRCSHADTSYPRDREIERSASPSLERAYATQRIPWQRRGPSGMIDIVCRQGEESHLIHKGTSRIPSLWERKGRKDRSFVHRAYRSGISGTYGRQIRAEQKQIGVSSPLSITPPL